MIRKLVTCLIIAGLLSLAATVMGTGGDEVSIDVKVSPAKIGMDEQAILEVTIAGPQQNLPDPKIPTLAAFEVYSQGRSSNISIVNGKVESSVTYRYVLIPQKAGTFPIDNIGVVYNNKRVNGNSVTLTVGGQGSGSATSTPDRLNETSGDGRDYLLEAAVDNKEPFVNQQVTLTLRFLTAVRYYGSPELTEPTTTGFWTEVIGNETPFYQAIDGRRYKVIERKYALFPTQTGELTIGRAAITTTVAAADNSRRDPFSVFNDFFGRGKEVVVRSQPIKLNVKPLPVSGRPEEFTGTIGKFNMSVRADKREVEVNQPIAVTISINGTGNVKSVAEPPIPELDDFRVYRASANEKTTTQNDKLGGTKVFEEVFIPKRPGDLEIPALTFAYFDPEAAQFRTIRSSPINVKVIRPEGYAGDADLPYRAPEMTIGSGARDIRHIRGDLGQLQPRNRLVLLTPLYMAINGFPVVVLAALVVWRRRRDRLTADRGLARARGASRMARKRLAKARSLASPAHTEAFHAEVYRALTSYLADKLNISPHGLTSDAISRILAERGAAQDLIDSVLDIVKACDFARFAPSSIGDEAIKKVLAEAEQVMVTIEGVKFA
ncbi:MAG: BatD family protein [bacterium]